MRIRPRSALLAALLPFLPVTATADEVHLNGGASLEGVVLDQSEQEVRLLLPGGAELRVATPWVRRIERASDAPGPGLHLRFAQGKAAGLFVALTHYVHPTLPRVDLVGAVHIADAPYFTQVQSLLDAADVVLYEGITKEGERPQPEPQEAENPIRRIQRMLGRLLELSFQLDAVNYDRLHFVHADLTAEQLNQEATSHVAPDAPAQGDAPTGPLAALGPIGPMLEQAGPMLETMLARQAENPAARRMLKRTLAQALAGADMDQALAALPPAVRTMILAQRNEVVLQRLQEIAPTAKGSIAIFYGAAHMTGIETDLVERLGYRRAGARWLKAWDLAEPQADPAPVASPATALEPKSQPGPKPQPEPSTPR